MNLKATEDNNQISFASKVGFVKSISKPSSILGFISLILASLILITPYLNVQFWYDDLVVHQLLARIHRMHTSYFSESLNEFNGWLFGSGRIHLYVFIQNAILLIQNAFFYHLAIVGLFFINILLFSILLREFNFSYDFIYVFILLLISLFHIADYHDVLASYAGTYQIFFITLCSALFLLLKWTKNFSLLYLGGSVSLIFLSLLVYEINLIYFPIAFFVILHFRKSVPLLRSFVVLFLPLLIYLIITLLVRAHTQNIGYSGVQFGSLQLFMITYLKQIVSIFPGLYYYVGGRHSNNLSTIWSSFILNYWGWLLAVTTVLTLSIFLNNSRKINKNSNVNSVVYLISLVILLSTPVFVAISQKYQAELNWGWGYLPIYYEAFPASLFLTFLIFKLSQNKITKVLVITILTFYISLNWMENWHNVDYLNEVFTEPTISLSKQLNEGLLIDVRDGDIIEIKDTYPHIHGNIIYTVTGKKVIIQGEPLYIQTKHPRHYVLENIGKIEGKTTYVLRNNDSLTDSNKKIKIGQNVWIRD